MNCIKWPLAGAILLCAIVPWKARGDGAYLPFVGPPPLRFKKADAKSILPSPRVAEMTNALPSAATNSTPTVMSPTNAVVVANSLPATNAVAAPEITPMSSDPDVLHIPPAGLLAVTPQMLASYLNPALGTNGDNTTVAPMKIGFLPPMPKRESDSSAVYQTK